MTFRCNRKDAKSAKSAKKLWDEFNSSKSEVIGVSLRLCCALERATPDFIYANLPHDDAERSLP